MGDGVSKFAIPRQWVCSPSPRKNTMDIALVHPKEFERLVNEAMNFVKKKFGRTVYRQDLLDYCVEAVYDIICRYEEGSVPLESYFRQTIGFRLLQYGRDNLWMRDNSAESRFVARAEFGASLDTMKSALGEPYPFVGEDRNEVMVVMKIFLKRYMKRLSQKEQQVLQMLFFKDMSIRDISKRIGMSALGVKLTRDAAIDSLRSHFVRSCDVVSLPPNEPSNLNNKWWGNKKSMFKSAKSHRAVEERIYGGSY